MMKVTTATAMAEMMITRVANTPDWKLRRKADKMLKAEAKKMLESGKPYKIAKAEEMGAKYYDDNKHIWAMDTNLSAGLNKITIDWVMIR